MGLKPTTPHVTAKSLQKAQTLSPAKLGAWWEDHIKAHLKYLAVTSNLYYYRMPDTKMAGNFLPDSPADFLVRTEKGTYLLEAKASNKHASLRSCLAANVSPAQALHHRLWHRAGSAHQISSYFLFCGTSVPTAQLWAGSYVANCRAEGKVLDVNYGMAVECGPANGGLMKILEKLL